MRCYDLNLDAIWKIVGFFLFSCYSLVVVGNTGFGNFTVRGNFNHQIMLVVLVDMTHVYLLHYADYSPRHKPVVTRWRLYVLDAMGHSTYYTKKHRGGCTRWLLRPGLLITNRARSVRLVINS